MNDSDSRQKIFQEAILSWFAVHHRHLPWRESHTPYEVWISEVMLQQTQMDRGVEYFLRWMQRFPDIAAVASASEDNLLRAWEGLGYYRRVRYIQSAAKSIMQEYGGVFPENYEAIRKLPGIGPYTAGSIASVAFNHPVPCVDANAERVLSRVFRIETDVRQEPAKSALIKLATELIPSGQARIFNQAIMELGALVCKKKPDCLACPLAEMCLAKKEQLTAKLPVYAQKAPIIRMAMATGILIRKGCVFIQRRKPEDVWGGLWEFPGGCVEKSETPQQTVLREWQEECGFAVEIQEPLPIIRHSYTRYRITLHGFLLDLLSEDKIAYPEPPILTEATAWQWLPLEQIQDIPLPAPHRKLAELCPALCSQKRELLQKDRH